MIHISWRSLVVWYICWLFTFGLCRGYELTHPVLSFFIYSFMWPFPLGIKVDELISILGAPR